MKTIISIILLAIIYYPNTSPTKNNNNSLDINILTQSTQAIPFEMSKTSISFFYDPILKSYQELSDTKESILEYKNKTLIFRHCDNILKKLALLDYSLRDYKQLFYFLDNIQRGEYKTIIWGKLFSNNFYFHT